MPQLTHRQRLFINEYLIDFNGTKAAMRAGYADSSAANAAWKLLKRDDVAELIKAAQEELKAVVRIDQQWVVGKLVQIVERCTQGEPILDKLGNQTQFWKFQPAGANKALELLGRHLGMFGDDLPQAPDRPTLDHDEREVLDVYVAKKVRTELEALGIVTKGNGADGNGRTGGRSFH